MNPIQQFNRTVIKQLLLILSIVFMGACASHPDNTKLEIAFKEEADRFTEQEKQLATDILTDAEKEVRTLLPNLPQGIKVVVEIVDWDIDVVGGVTGRTESNTPPLVFIQVSRTFPGGVVSALNAGLRSTVFHEFHHLALGWAINDNKFTPDIPTATVIEGLAEVFAEEYTGAVFDANRMPEGIDGNDWVIEILALPKDANYQTWMFQHPDGRTSIGYRAGNYLVRKAMHSSQKTILELSNVSPDKLLELAGY